MTIIETLRFSAQNLNSNFSQYLKPSMTDANTYHSLAKDAGNKLKSYIIAFASGATAVFFLTLADSTATFTPWQTAYIISALILFVATTVICLYELHVDARRFFNLAKQLERPKDEQMWDQNDIYKIRRICLIKASYITLLLAVAASVLFLIARVT